jgi:hypothetical protein
MSDLRVVRRCDRYRVEYLWKPWLLKPMWSIAVKDCFTEEPAIFYTKEDAIRFARSLDENADVVVWRNDI